jgi:hypothetical protein
VKLVAFAIGLPLPVRGFDPAPGRRFRRRHHAMDRIAARALSLRGSPAGPAFIGQQVFAMPIRETAGLGHWRRRQTGVWLARRARPLPHPPLILALPMGRPVANLTDAARTVRLRAHIWITGPVPVGCSTVRGALIRRQHLAVTVLEAACGRRRGIWAIVCCARLARVGYPALRGAVRSKKHLAVTVLEAACADPAGAGIRLARHVIPLVGAAAALAIRR